MTLKCVQYSGTNLLNWTIRLIWKEVIGMGKLNLFINLLIGNRICLLYV